MAAIEVRRNALISVINKVRKKVYRKVLLIFENSTFCFGGVMQGGKGQTTYYIGEYLDSVTEDYNNNFLLPVEIILKV